MPSRFLAYVTHYLPTAKIFKWQKCARMGLNGFVFKKLNKNRNIRMNKILGAIQKLPAKMINR